MAAINKSEMVLRISGDDLDPEKISSLLCGEATESYVKGETLYSSKGRSRIAKTGYWSFSAKCSNSGDLNGQVREILDSLCSNLEIWIEIQKNYQVDIFCGLFMRSKNEGIEINSKTLTMLAERNIKIGFDIYAPFSEE